jgi:cyanophycinase
VLVADLSEAVTDTRLGRFNLRNARLSYLDRGDRYDLRQRRTLPSPEKLNGTRIDPNAADFKPYFTRDAFYPDVLGDTTVANLMANLVDNRQREVVGLAFGSPDGPRPELGWEFRFRKTPRSLGYYSGAFGGEDYTVVEIALDVTPVAMQLPLYVPVSPPGAPAAAGAPSPSPSPSPPQEPPR